MALSQLGVVAKTLAQDERGQDLIEYALLTSLFGLIGISAWAAIQSGIGTSYRNYILNTETLCVPPRPASGS